MMKAESGPSYPIRAPWCKTPVRVRPSVPGYCWSASAQAAGMRGLGEVGSVSDSENTSNDGVSLGRRGGTD